MDNSQEIRKFHAYSMLSDSKKKLNFRVYDVRGIESLQSIKTEDVLSILDGHMKNDYTINTEKAIDASHPKYRKNPKPKDKIHCIVWCFDATVEYTSINDADRLQIKEIQTSALHRGIGQLVVLSKIDEIEKVLLTEVDKVFHSRDIQRCVEKFAHSFGLPVGFVHPIKNYAQETSRSTELEILALYIFKQILSRVDDVLRNLLDEDLSCQQSCSIF